MTSDEKAAFLADRREAYGTSPRAPIDPDDFLFWQAATARQRERADRAEAAIQRIHAALTSAGIHDAGRDGIQLRVVNALARMERAERRLHELGEVVDESPVFAARIRTGGEDERG